MSRAQMTMVAVVVGIAIFFGVALNIALVIFSVVSTRDIVRLDSQVRELTSVVAVLNNSLREASSSSELRLETLNMALKEKSSSTEKRLEILKGSVDVKFDSLNSSFTTSLHALALQQDVLERSSVPLTSCQKYRDIGIHQSGVYTLYLRDGGAPFPVYCDMQSDGYGWTVFQRRVDGSEDFYRTWADYKAGFGHLEAEFWLGNDKLHRLTSAGLTRLRVDLGDWQNNTAYALYSSFSVAGEEDNYRLSLSGYSGNANNSFSSWSGTMFTTRDRDNDARSIGNCADVHASGWWFQNCTAANLNGPYNGTYTFLSIFWFHWHDHYDPLKWTEMKLLDNVI